MLDIVASYHCMSFQGILVNQTWENSNKKKVSGPPFTHLAQIRAAIIFIKNVAASVTGSHGQLSSYTISEKTNDPILRKPSDRWTDGRMDRRTRVIS